MLNNETTMTPQNLPNLAPALIKALAETQDVIADSTNPFHNSKYASLSQHLKSIKPIFAKHGLAIVQFPTSPQFESGVGVKTIIMHTSGEMLESSVTIEAPFEKGKDKNGNDFERKGFTGQQAGALVSYLRRYALASAAGVATEDDDAETDRAVYAGPSVVSKSNYIPNPNASGQTLQTPSTSVTRSASPSTAVGGTLPPNAFPIENVDDIESILMPFGKNKGTPLNQLSRNDWEWIVNKMELKPFNGNISKKDIKLKNAARILLEGGNSASNDSDDVPF